MFICLYWQEKNSSLQRLENILENKKPFLNFKNKVDHSDFRQNWFEFKQKELEKRVENELERGKPAHNNVYKK